mmetsp:Transcript_27938/g.41566  ORF Transcript_27938/g.41566 Transcript_27938/m.41566 type:complete len:88 (+) Transcript_27938:590-853(+)
MPLRFNGQSIKVIVMVFFLFLKQGDFFITHSGGRKGWNGLLQSKNFRIREVSMRAKPSVASAYHLPEFLEEMEKEEWEVKANEHYNR